MAKLGLLGIIYGIWKPPALLKPWLCWHFWFIIFPGRCEFTPPNMGEKNSNCAYFFCGGLHRKWKLFWNTQMEAYRMKAVHVGIFCNSGIFLYVFQNILSFTYLKVPWHQKLLICNRMKNGVYSAKKLQF